MAEAGNFAAVQRVIQTNPYWAAYAQNSVAQSGIISNLDAAYLRSSNIPGAAAIGAAGMGMGPRPVLPRLFIQGLQQHINQMPAHPGLPPAGLPPAAGMPPPMLGLHPGLASSLYAPEPRLASPSSSPRAGLNASPAAVAPSPSV